MLVKRYLAQRLAAISDKLTNCMAAAATGELGESHRTQAIGDIQKCLNDISPDLDFLGLKLTKMAVDRLLPNVGTLGGSDLVDAINDIAHRLNDELSLLFLYYLPPNKRDYLDQTELFGEQFKNGFPVANAEVIEAGNCFAFGRHTACVFHLMRACEIVILALLAGLKLTPPPKPTWSWKTILDRISDEISRRNRQSPLDASWASEKLFYEQALAFLAAAKNPIRNSTMHVESVYDESGAENVFNSMKGFMAHVATKLAEAP